MVRHGSALSPNTGRQKAFVNNLSVTKNVLTIILKHILLSNVEEHCSICYNYIVLYASLLFS